MLVSQTLPFSYWGHDGRGVYSFLLDRMKVLTLGSSLVLHVDGVTR